jgi:predicted dehydrogenase
MVLRVGIIGCGERARSVYLPVLRKMRSYFGIVGVCDPDEGRRAILAETEGVPHFAELSEMLEQTKPDFVVIAVTPPPSDANEKIVDLVVDAGVHILAETPIASTKAGCRKILDRTAKVQELKIEYGENYFRTPFERFVTTVFDAGVFGDRNVAYADFVGHGYHGIGVLRAQIGRDIPVRSVIGLAKNYHVQSHLYRLGAPRCDSETWQLAVIEFANGACGVQSFSTIAYGSPLRWGREKILTRVYAECGMRFGDELALLDGDKTRPLVPKYHVQSCADGETVAAISLDWPQKIVWDNPLRALGLTSGDQHSELTIGLQCLSLFRAITQGTPVEYGVNDAYDDRLIDLAIDESRAADGSTILL